MNRIVADSSALILLAKCGYLEILCDLFEIIAPSAVISEVASDKMVKQYPDAALIANLISNGRLKVGDPEKADFQMPLSLHQGENDALSIAMELRNSLFATDDGKAIKAAKFLRVPFIITPKIIIELFRLQKISIEDARKSIEKLSIIGSYSPDIIADVLVLLTEVSNGKTHNNKNT